MWTGTRALVPLGAHRRRNHRRLSREHGLEGYCLTPMDETIELNLGQQIRARLSQLRAPLYRNSIYLFAGTLVSAGCGFIFWFIGARATSPADVGIAQASIGSA